MNDFGSSITFDNFNNSYDEKESEIPYESLFNLFLILRDSSPRNCNLCQNATDDRIFSGCCQETFCRPCIDTYLKFSIACPDCSSPFTFYFCDVGINVKNYKVGNILYIFKNS
ncbi:hypothetical protein HZS_2725 [Henneguya salminicola]|nr:hypothetical protein HZS_2725 [Henneguya salminicola]